MFYNKLGACGEFSTLFMEMAKNAGIQIRIASTLAEDHQWNEVLIKDRWVHVDSTLDPSASFDNPHVYENEWKWNLSKVYAYYNGEQIDVTNKYFEKIGVLNVTVNENNLPAENVEVVVKSQFRMERDPDLYKVPRQTTYCITASNGTCSFYLGESNYTILVRKGDVPFRFSPYLLEFEQKNVTLTANATNELVFSFPETKLNPLSGLVYLMIGYIFIIGYFAKVKLDFRIKNITNPFLKSWQKFQGNLTSMVRKATKK
ncbi:MAG TPA: transglutaminase domain-containing protein [Candidatus Methanoperedens sp.]